MRKTGSITMSIALLLFLLSVMLSIMHLPAARLLLVFSILMFLLVSAAGIFAPNSMIRYLSLYDSTFNRRRQQATYLMNLGAFVGLVGLLLKLSHHKWALPVIDTGTCSFMIGYIMWMVNNFRRDRHIISYSNEEDLSQMDDLNLFCGRYYNSHIKYEMNIWIADGILTAQVKGQSSFPLKRVEKNVYNYGPWGVVIEFKPETDEFILIQRGQYIRFSKR